VPDGQCRPTIVVSGVEGGGVVFVPHSQNGTAAPPVNQNRSKTLTVLHHHQSQAVLLEPELPPWSSSTEPGADGTTDHGSLITHRQQQVAIRRIYKK